MNARFFLFLILLRFYATTIIYGTHRPRFSSTEVFTCNLLVLKTVLHGVHGLNHRKEHASMIFCQ